MLIKENPIFIYLSSLYNSCNKHVLYPYSVCYLRCYILGVPISSYFFNNIFSNKPISSLIVKKKKKLNKSALTRKDTTSPYGCKIAKILFMG